LDVLTVTPNPAVDDSIWYRRKGELNEILRERREAGGKGINVCRAVHGAGGRTGAIILAGPAGSDPFWNLVEPLPFSCLGADLKRGAVRTNYTFVEEESGTVQKFNNPGPSVSAFEVEGLLELLDSQLKVEPVVALCGSLPPGAPTDFYARCIQLVQAQYGLDCALDTSGAPLAEAIKHAPFLIKPNLEEARNLLSVMKGNSEGDPCRIAQSLLDMGPRQVLLSLGGEGAVLATGDGTWKASGPPVRVRNTVGCGDVLLGVYLHFQARVKPEEALRLAVGAAGIAAARDGSADIGTPSREDMARGVNVERLW
jgi:1-phosphofructokinase